MQNRQKADDEKVFNNNPEPNTRLTDYSFELKKVNIPDEKPKDIEETHICLWTSKNGLYESSEPLIRSHMVKQVFNLNQKYQRALFIGKNKEVFFFTNLEEDDELLELQPVIASLKILKIA